MSDNFQQEGEINSSDNIISDPVNSNVQTSSDISNNAGDAVNTINNRISGLESNINLQFSEMIVRFEHVEVQFNDFIKKMK